VTPPATLSRTLHTLADFAEIRGALAEAAETRQAAVAIAALVPARLTELVHRGGENPREDESGISPAVRLSMRNLALVGAEVAIAAAQARLPRLFRWLLERGVITPDEAATLVRQAGVLTLPDLVASLDAERIAGALLAGRLRDALHELSADVQPVSLGRAWEQLHWLATAIPIACPAVDLITTAGDVRRFEPLVSSMILVARASDPPPAIAAITAMHGIDGVVHQSDRRAIVVMHQAEIDIRLATPDEYGTALFTATGSDTHLRAMQQRQRDQQPCQDEEEVYRRAGLPYIPPELRQGHDEIDAAASGTLPELVAQHHIRGDLHMHTTYSDGADTLDAMVAEAAALGYEYIAITDHSERAGASRTLTRADLARQRDEIAAIRVRYPQLAILHGVEVDIMPDGCLDFPDEMLEPLDIVLASLHDDARQNAAALTRRCIQAIRHPLVTIITHPANQIVGRRAGYALDFEAIYAAAAETGTALEVDGAPAHLDLDGEHARAAGAAGVTLAIDSDCHRARALDRQMQMGIGTARRGWIEPRQVLNARPLADVRAFISAKRTRR
jgi:DNA polymerase (family 10)